MAPVTSIDSAEAERVLLAYASAMTGLRHLPTVH